MSSAKSTGLLFWPWYGEPLESDSVAMAVTWYGPFHASAWSDGTNPEKVHC